MSITENIARIGNFTSSNTHKLMTLAKNGKDFGSPALTYIKEKNYERKLKRSLELEKDSRATLWGKLLELYVQEMLPLEYEPCGHESILHPKIAYWAGSPDNKNSVHRIVGDIKAYEPKGFCEYVDALSGGIGVFKKECPKEYYQLVSNACILGYENIEAIAFMPYESEILAIREFAANYDGDDQYKYRFIAEAPLQELPYLPDGGYYKNLNQFRFQVPAEDKAALQANIIKAGSLLIARN